MTIRIIDEPEITMTRAEYERLHREWCASNGMTVAPTSFEAFVAGRLLPLDQRAVTADEDRVLRRAIWDSCTLVAKGKLRSQP